MGVGASTVKVKKKNKLKQQQQEKKKPHGFMGEFILVYYLLYENLDKYLDYQGKSESLPRSL